MGKNIYKGGNIYIYIGKINLTFRYNYYFLWYFTINELYLRILI